MIDGDGYVGELGEDGARDSPRRRRARASGWTRSPPTSVPAVVDGGTASRCSSRAGSPRAARPSSERRVEAARRHVVHRAHPRSGSGSGLPWRHAQTVASSSSAGSPRAASRRRRSSWPASSRATTSPGQQVDEDAELDRRAPAAVRLARRREARARARRARRRPARAATASTSARRRAASPTACSSAARRA